MMRRHWRYAPIVLLGGLVAADADPAACPACFHEGYQVDLSKVSLLPDPPAAILFSGYRDGHCQDDVMCTAGSDRVWLGDLGQANGYNWWNRCSQREMVVFAGGHAPTPLSPAAGDLSPIQPTLPDAAVLTLAVWVEGPGPTPKEKVEAQDRLNNADFVLGKTQQIFDALGAGIKLDYTLNQLPHVIPGPVDHLLDDATCDIAKKLMDGLSSGGAMAAMQDPARLNVYFVGYIHGDPDGWTCYGDKDPNKSRYVILVSKVVHTPSTLAHEIGHALGLLMRATLPDGTPSPDDGDVNELKLDPYLPVDNLMYSGVGDVAQITVGEVYRMHFDKHSWLWHGVTGSGGYPRQCQADPVVGGPCPPLTLQPTRGWP
jgi:hypothetical protein